MLAVAFAPQPWIAGPAVVVCAGGAAVLAGVPAGLFLRVMVAPLGFLAAGALVLCITVRWGATGPLVQVTPDGAATAWVASARTLGATSATLLLALTVPLPTLLDLLRRLRVPLAVRDLLLLTYRTIFLLDDCAQALRRTQLARLGYRNPRRALHTLAGTVQALLVLALQRATRWERGLAARGYHGDLTVLQPTYAHPPLGYAAAVSVPAILAIAAWRWPGPFTP